MVGNLHPRYRSQQRFIHLALLVKHKYIKLYDIGYSTVMQCLTHDLCILQTEGIHVVVNGTSKVIKGKLISVSADNLSAHSLAGFQQHFQHGRVCRFCMIDHADLGSCFSEHTTSLRTAESHNYHLRAISEDASNATVYGVRKPCALQSLPGFSVVSSFPPDIMHDLFEGVIPHTVQLVVRDIISSGHSSLSQLNGTLENITLSRPENKPCLLTDSALKSGGHITGTAVQKLELFLILPQLIGTSVPENSTVWQVYLKLRCICDIVLSPVVEKDSAVELEELVASFLSLFVSCFDARLVTPKMHYLIHYPRMIKLFGGLKNFWCLRFESKHQYFKKVAQQTKCFKNITKTLAKRHQMLQAWEMTSEEILLSSSNAVSKTKGLKFDKLSHNVQESIAQALKEAFESSEGVISAKCLSANNAVYKVQGIYILNVIHEEKVPLFLQVKHVFSVRNVWVLCGRMLVPQRFDVHIHAYEVVTDSSWITCRPEELAGPTMHDMFSVNDHLFVSLRHECFRAQM